MDTCIIEPVIQIDIEDSRRKCIEPDIQTDKEDSRHKSSV